MTDPHQPGDAAADPRSAAGRPFTRQEEAEAIYRRAGLVTVLTLGSRVLGMARDLVIAHRFGATGATDAWVQAFRIPNALRRLTAEGSMTIAFIPIYVRVRESEGPQAARLFSRNVLGLVLCLTVVLAALGIAFAEGLTTAFSPGFVGDPEKFAATAALIRGTFPYLVLVSLVAWAMGVLNSEGHFAAPAAAPMLLNIGIIAAVLAASGWFPRPILSIALGVLAGGVLQVLLQGPALWRHGVVPWPRFAWRDPHLRALFRVLGPSLLGVAVYEVNIIVLGIIASFLPSGQIFHYNNATRLTELVMGLFAFAFTTVGHPTLSEHRARQDWARMRETLHHTFAAIQFTILPAMAGLIAAGPAVVAMLYLHGAYGYADVRTTTGALRFLALGMPAVAAVRQLVAVFYAFEDSRTPALVSALTLLVTGGLGWWWSQLWQVLGLAAGLSAGTWFQCVLLAVLLRRRAQRLGPWLPWRPMLAQAGAAAAVALGAWWAVGFGDWSLGPFALLNWLVFAATLVGAVVAYLLLTWGLGSREARNWLHLLGRIAGRLRHRDGGAPPPREP